MVLFEQRAQPLTLLRGQHHGCRLAPRGEGRDGALLTHQRLTFDPSQIDGVGRPFARGQAEVGPRAEVVQPIQDYLRQRETARELAPAGLCRCEHRRFVQHGARLRSLAVRLEIEDHRVFRQVVEQRGPRGVEISRVELDAREGRTGLQARQLVLPVGQHIAAQPAQRHRLAQPRHRGGAPSGSEEELAAGPDRDLRDRHHRPLVLGVEQAQRFDDITGPFGPHR